MKDRTYLSRLSTPNPNRPSYPNPHPAPCPAAPAILDLLHLQTGATVGVAVADGRLVVDPKPRPRYTLAELLAEASGRYPLSAEEREWIDAPAAGKELI